jgi:hypothetical protein
MSVWDIPEEVICDDCKERIADNKKAAQMAAQKRERKPRRQGRIAFKRA